MTFQANFYEAGVRSVTLERSSGGVKVAIGLLGTQSENQAPTIFVTLYDENGVVLSRSPVVSYTLPLLSQGEAQEVKDEMTLPNEAEPAIVSVDDPKHNKMHWLDDG